MSFSGQEPDSPYQESPPPHQQQLHHLHLHQQDHEAHLQQQQHSPHQHDYAAHQQEDELANSFDSYPPYIQQAWRTQLNRARQESATPVNITYQFHEDVSLFDPSVLSIPVNQTQQMTDRGAGAPVEASVSDHDPAEVDISDFGGYTGGMDPRPPREGSDNIYPPDISNIRAYPYVDQHPVVSTQPPLVTPMKDGKGSAPALGFQEYEKTARAGLPETSRGKLLLERNAVEGGDSNTSRPPISTKVLSQTPTITQRNGKREANAANAESLRPSVAYPQIGRDPQVRSAGPAVRKNLMAPGPAYRPGRPEAQFLYTLSSQPLSTSRDPRISGGSANAHSFNQAATEAESEVDFDSTVYRQLHRRVESRSDSRGQHVDFTCLFFTHPEVVQEWIQAGRTNKEVQYLVQYYQQLSQVYGHRKVDFLMQIRDQPPQDHLDHRMQFSNTNGIPTYWFELQAGPWESTSVAQSQPRAKRAGHNFVIVSARRPHEVIPIGATLEYIGTNMPNHHQYEHMDFFLQQNIPAAQIWNALPDETKTILQNNGVATDKWKPNFLLKRKQRRQDSLVHQYGSNVVLDFYESELKLREKGNLPDEKSNEKLPGRDVPPSRLQSAANSVVNEVSDEGADADSPEQPVHAPGAEVPAVRKQSKAISARTASVTGTQRVHTSAAPAPGNLTPTLLLYNNSPPMQQTPTIPHKHHRGTESMSVSPQNAGKQAAQHKMATSTDKTFDEASPSTEGEADPPSVQPKQPLHSQPSEKALGKRPAVETANFDAAPQGAMSSAQPRPSEKALGKRPASSGFVDPRLQALGARPAQMKGGRRGPTKGRKGKATQVGPKKSGVDGLAGPTATEETEQPEQGVTKQGAERGQRFLQQMGLAEIVQPSGRPALVAASALTSAPAPAPVGLPVFENGQRISRGGLAEGRSHADYSHLPPSKRPAYIITDAERQALVADANWKVQTRQPLTNPDYAPRVLAADVPVSLQDMSTILPDSATIERWRRDEDEEFERRARVHAEWEAAREDQEGQEQGGQEPPGEERVDERESEELLKAPSDAFIPEEAP